MKRGGVSAGRRKYFPVGSLPASLPPDARRNPSPLHALDAHPFGRAGVFRGSRGCLSAGDTASDWVGGGGRRPSGGRMPQASVQGCIYSVSTTASPKPCFPCSDQLPTKHERSRPWHSAPLSPRPHPQGEGTLGSGPVLGYGVVANATHQPGVQLADSQPAGGTRLSSQRRA
jgi:hypothetical protein